MTEMMKLKRPLPENRSFEQIKNHYLVEKSIAERLKRAGREERKVIYASMYEELFSKVPDHPRLTRRQSPELTTKANRIKRGLIERFIDESTIFLEFAPGDCRFASEIAKDVQFVYGIDISDQRNQSDNVPDNFKLLIYDGYELEEPINNSIDLVFSDQLIEHFHPEDTALHFKIVHRILKPGGKYVFRTPHLFKGPTDISKYFSDSPEGFHLKEWTNLEIANQIRSSGFSKIHSHEYWTIKGLRLRKPFFYLESLERLFNLAPKPYRAFISSYIPFFISCTATK